MRPYVVPSLFCCSPYILPVINSLLEPITMMYALAKLGR